MTKTHLLFLVILIEGYVVLASELLAIRQLIPFVGSGTETVAIIISAVLMPLALGYHAGGRAFRASYLKTRKRGRKAHSIRKLLLKNILSSLTVLGLGLSYPFLEIFFEVLSHLGISHRLPQTALYSLMFLVLPVYLLGQTVPLVSNYFSRARLSEITGKMLFFSTTGSFLGSILSTLVLMSFLGVHNTVIVTMGLLFVLTLLLARRILSYDVLISAMAMGFIVLLNSGALMKQLGIVSNNAYNTAAVIRVPGEPEARMLVLNRSSSSKVTPDAEKNFEYWKYVERVFIEPMQHTAEPMRILIIGAGGFTVGMHDTRNLYTYVDIDHDLKRVAEDHFLKEKLTPNKHFEAASARAFVRADKQEYDLILIDAYTNVYSIPMECTTKEFLEDVKRRLKPGGAVIANVISSPDFRDPFTRRYHNTFVSIFPLTTRQVIDDFNPWRTDGKGINNVLYVYYDRPGADDRTVYTDDLNTYTVDRP